MAHHGGRRSGAGRPKRRQQQAAEKASLRTLARAHSETAIAALAAIAAEGKSEAARIAAAVALLDRGYGRPAATTEPAEDDGNAGARREATSDLELARAIAFILAKAGTDGGPT